MPEVLLTEDHVIGLLRGVIDPELGSDIVELGMAKKIEISENNEVTVTIALTTSGCPLRAQIQKDVRSRVGTLKGVKNVKIVWTVLTQEEKAAVMKKARFNITQDAPATEVPATTKVIMVASGKGGVGKSSVSVNISAGIAARGFVVGVMDADIWGFSVPRMLGINGRLEGEKESKKITPHERPVGDGLLKVVSMGFLVDNESVSLNWRGLMLNRAVRHFLEDVQWGEMDYLVIDMPPGTGDVQMGLAKMLPRADLIVVTTPAKTAQAVAVRVGNMARSYYLRIAGVIENMTAFLNEEGVKYELFGSGGGLSLATELGVPLLGSVPIEPRIAECDDSGDLAVLGTGAAAEAFQSIVNTIIDEAIPPLEMSECTARLLNPDHVGLNNTSPVTTAVEID